MSTRLTLLCWRTGRYPYMGAICCPKDHLGSLITNYSAELSIVNNEGGRETFSVNLDFDARFCHNVGIIGHSFVSRTGAIPAAPGTVPDDALFYIGPSWPAPAHLSMQIRSLQHNE